MTWQPLSRRTRNLEPDGPYEGVPAHLVSGLARWLDGALRDGVTVIRGDDVRSVAMRLRVPHPHSATTMTASVPCFSMQARVKTRT